MDYRFFSTPPAQPLFSTAQLCLAAFARHCWGVVSRNLRVEKVVNRSLLGYDSFTMVLDRGRL